MGRRKKNIRESWWRGVERYLRREEDIRQAVKEERAGLSFLRAADMGAGGKGGKRPDRTAALAVKRTEELPAVVLDNGETVKRPESWLECFDAVRAAAKKCERPEWILEDWRRRYDEGIRDVMELIGGRLERGCFAEEYSLHDTILWIIESVEAAAMERGLLSADDCLLYGRPPVDFFGNVPAAKVGLKRKRGAAFGKYPLRAPERGQGARQKIPR